MSSCPSTLDDGGGHIARGTAYEWPRYRSSDAVPIGQLVRQWAGERLSEPHEVFSAVWAAWRDLLPPGLAAHCELGGVAGGRLVVHAESAAYGYELQLCKAELLEQIRLVCPQAGVKEIKVAVR